MPAGRSTLATNSPACVDCSMPIRSESPSVVPNSVAEVAPAPQKTAKVTLEPGTATDGVTSMTGAGTAAKAGAPDTATVAAPASASAVAAQRMKRIVSVPRSDAGPPRAVSQARGGPGGRLSAYPGITVGVHSVALRNMWPTVAHVTDESRGKSLRRGGVEIP